MTTGILQIILFLLAWFTNESVNPNVIAFVTALDPELKDFMSGKIIRVTALHVLILSY